MSDQPHRKRGNRGLPVLQASLPKIFPGNPLQAASIEDKANWNGFCEIESEPVSTYKTRIA